MNEGENREMKEGGREGWREEGDEGEGKGREWAMVFCFCFNLLFFRS